MFLPHCAAITASDQSPEHWLVVLHGIYGRGGNWRGFARKLCEARPAWGVLLTDLRMHGSSMAAPAPHTLESTALDVLHLIDRKREEGVTVGAVLGHSFGGKVALDMLRLRPELGALWIVDSSPGARPAAMSDPDNTVVAVLRMLRELPSLFADRNEFIGQVLKRGFARPLAQWLAMNLGPEPGGGYRNHLNPSAMTDLLEDYFQQDRWAVLEGARASIRFAIATEGSSVSREEAERLGEMSARGQVHVHSVVGSHWLHVDALEPLVALVAQSL